MTRSNLMVSALLFALVAGCDDPAADKPKATVSSATPVTNLAAAAKPSQSASAAAAPAAGALKIAPGKSTIGFVGSKVTGSHTGEFKSFTGSLELSADKLEASKVTIEIDMDSAKTDSDKLDGHLKSPDLFDVAKFPKAKFVSTEIKAGGDKGATHTITGNLELHGETKTISFPATVKVTDAEVTATSEFSINRKDFKILYAGKADDLIRDDVVIKLNISVPRK